MLTTFWHLLAADLRLMRKTIVDKLINSIIWGFSVLLISAYVLRAFGMPESFGVFQAGSLLISIFGFEMYAQIFSLVADIEGNEHMQYYFTLPIPNWVVIAKMVTMYAINGLFLSLVILGICKLILWNQLVLSQIDWIRFWITLIVGSFFFSFFTLFLVSLIKNVETIENIMMRILFPIWFFGGFNFSFLVAYQTLPALGYVMLINPYTFFHEAIRSTIRGTADFLPFGLNMMVAIAMTVVAAYVGYTRLRSKLDLV